MIWYLDIIISDFVTLIGSLGSLEIPLIKNFQNFYRANSN